MFTNLAIMINHCLSQQEHDLDLLKVCYTVVVYQVFHWLSMFIMGIEVKTLQFSLRSKSVKTILNDRLFVMSFK